MGLLRSGGGEAGGPWCPDEETINQFCPRLSAGLFHIVPGTLTDVVPVKSAKGVHTIAEAFIAVYINGDASVSVLLGAPLMRGSGSSE